MILKKTRKRIERLYEEIKAKSGAKIDAKHVQQILDKIDRKERKTLEALAHARDSAEKDKLNRKLAVIDEQRERGKALLGMVKG